MRERTGRGEALYELDEAADSRASGWTSSSPRPCAPSVPCRSRTYRPWPSACPPAPGGHLARPVHHRRGTRRRDAPRRHGRCAGRRGPARGGVGRADRGGGGARWPRRRARGPPPWSGSTRCTWGGHWVPQMIELAGGLDVLGFDRRALAHGGVVRGGGSGAGGGGVHAVRPVRGSRRRPRPCGTASAWGASTRAWWPWTPRPISRAPAHGWWTAWSCSATSCTRSSCRRPIRGARSRSTWRARPSELRWAVVGLGGGCRQVVRVGGERLRRRGRGHRRRRLGSFVRVPLSGLVSRDSGRRHGLQPRIEMNVGGNSSP